MRLFKAKIKWKNPENIPPVLKSEYRDKKNAYTPIIELENQYPGPIFIGNQSNYPLWSAIVFNDIIEGNESISFVSYLVENAPFELLKKGVKFRLYEGASIVARGRIIG